MPLDSITPPSKEGDECNHKSVSLVEIEEHPHDAVDYDGPVTTYKCDDCGALNISGAENYLSDPDVVDALKREMEE